MISEDRLGHWVHLIIDSLYDDDLVDYTDDDLAMRMARKAALAWAKSENDLDSVVRAKLTTLKRTLIEGTPEWEILYKKYLEEELNRRGQKS